MNTARLSALCGLSLLALVAGCDKKAGKVPTGQVVASVNGTDITVHELNSELAQTQAPPEVPRKKVETAVLQRVVERRMLADAARARGLDKNPAFLLTQRRVEDNLLVQALQASVAQKVGVPTREAAQKYMTSHPTLFAGRKIYTIDQIQFLQPKNLADLNLGPLKTMAEVETVLNTAHIEFRRQPATVDSLAVNPKLIAAIDQITARNPNEVFMFADQPQGAPAPVMLINHVTAAKVLPFGGEKAISFAQQLLQRETVQAKLLEEFKSIQTAAKPKITYAEGYAPPPPPPVAPAAAPAAAPAPAAN